MVGHHHRNKHIKKNKNFFLRKYLSNYNEKEKYFNLNNTIPVEDFPFIYEQLFRMNFLVANGDGVIGVFEVTCN